MSRGFFLQEVWLFLALYMPCNYCFCFPFLLYRWSDPRSKGKQLSKSKEPFALPDSLPTTSPPRVLILWFKSGILFAAIKSNIIKCLLAVMILWGSGCLHVYTRRHPRHRRLSLALYTPGINIHKMSFVSISEFLNFPPKIPANLLWNLSRDGMPSGRKTLGGGGVNTGGTGRIGGPGAGGRKFCLFLTLPGSNFRLTVALPAPSKRKHLEKVGSRTSPRKLKLTGLVRVCLISLQGYYLTFLVCLFFSHGEMLQTFFFSRKFRPVQPRQTPPTALEIRR